MISVLPKPPPFLCLCPHSQSKMISLYYRLQSGAVNTLPLGRTLGRGMHLNACMQRLIILCFPLDRAAAARTVCRFSRSYPAIAHFLAWRLLSRRTAERPWRWKGQTDERARRLSVTLSLFLVCFPLRLPQMNKFKRPIVNNSTVIHISLTRTSCLFTCVCPSSLHVHSSR